MRDLRIFNHKYTSQAIESSEVIMILKKVAEFPAK